MEQHENLMRGLACLELKIKDHPYKNKWPQIGFLF